MTELKRLCERHRVTIRNREVGPPTTRTWANERGATHWRSTLRLAGRQMTVDFHMGAAHCAEPDAAGVLSCLLSDVSSVEYAGFEEWCADMGYDSDSLAAERTYRACETLAPKLRRLLGEHFETFQAAEH